MIETLTFSDFEKLNNALMEVEKVIQEYYQPLMKCKNYKDLAVLSQLKIKLDEAEKIIVDECRARLEENEEQP